MKYLFNFTSQTNKDMKNLTAAQIETLANGKNVSTVIPSQFEEVEYLVVKISTFVSAYFLMDNTTFNYSYSHTYNAATDKKTKRFPKQLAN